MKIDILDDYIWTPEWFRGLSDIYRSTGGLPEPPRRLLGLMGPIGGRGEEAKGQPRAPPPKSELYKEGGGAPPPFLSPSLLPSPLLVQQGREGVLLPVGVGLLLARLLLAGRTSPLSFIYGGRGAPQGTTIDLIF